MHRTHQTPVQKEKKVVEVLKRYYKPAVITGRIVNTAGDFVENMSVHTEDGASITSTDKKGNFRLVIPAKTTKIIIEDTEKYIGESFLLSPNLAENISVSVTVKPQKLLFLYQVKTFIHHIMDNK